MATCFAFLQQLEKKPIGKGKEGNRNFFLLLQTLNKNLFPLFDHEMLMIHDEKKFMKIKQTNSTTNWCEFPHFLTATM